MPDSFTSSLGLCQPEVGASRDSWGTKWNHNATILDQYVSQSAPIGMLADFAGPNAPSGWLIADGRAISRTTYSNLFAVIGTTWGAGDGSTTFNLPNLNGRSTVGPGTVVDQAGISTTFTLAQQFGMVYNYIGQQYLPNYALYVDYQGQHSHGGASVAAGGHNHGMDAQGNHNHDTGGAGGGAAANGDHSHTGYTDAQGDHAHSYQATTYQASGPFGPGSSIQVYGFAANTSNAGNHQHNIQTYNAGNHVHALYWDGNHAHNVSFVGDHQHGINADGSHIHNVYLNGGGNPFEVMSPILVVTRIIYCGSQASTMAALDAAPTATDTTDELAQIREELAALRALFAPVQRRVPVTPSRGMN